MTRYNRREDDKIGHKGGKIDTGGYDKKRAEKSMTK